MPAATEHDFDDSRGSPEEAIYSHRFSEAEKRVRLETWKVLVPEFLQQYIDPEDCVIDVGAGDGLFISSIQAARRVAVDLSPRVQKLNRDGIEVLQLSALELSSGFDGQADVIFMSNFLEHLPSKPDVIRLFNECRRTLAPDGIVMVLQPNIRYVGAAYWDYIDHRIALTDRSVREALEATGFSVERCIPRFLPYTADSRLGRLAARRGLQPLIRLYLRLPLLWPLFGQQTFIVARKTADAAAPERLNQL